MGNSSRKRTGVKPAADAPTIDDLYLDGDPIPLPEVVDQDSEACWSLWNELSQFDESSLSPPSVWTATKPASPDAEGKSQSRPAEPLTVEKVLDTARRNNRVCPRPGQWMQLYDLITGGARPGAQGRPPEPITGRAWERTSAIQKRLCLRDQIFWADAYCNLGMANDFLATLSEDEWYHMGQ